MRYIQKEFLYILIEQDDRTSELNALNEGDPAAFDHISAHILAAIAS